MGCQRATVISPNGGATFTRTRLRTRMRAMLREISRMASESDSLPLNTAPRASGKRARSQEAVILSVEPQTPRISSIFLAPSQPFAYLPGQHLGVRVNTRGSSAERKYSIASAPESGAIIELAVEALPGGEVSGYLHSPAAVGQTVQIRGPRGDFTWSVADGPVLLIGGGSGVVPLMSMVRHRAARGSAVPLGLIYSAATWEDVPFRDELLELAEKRDGFELALTLTRDSRQHPNTHARRIDAAMVREVQQRLPAAVSGVFICGSDSFCNAASRLVTELGVASGAVQVESYGIDTTAPARA